MSTLDSRGNSHLHIDGIIVPTDQELAEGFMLRAVAILGVLHHCEFIRVEVVDDLQQAWKSDTSDPDNDSRFDDMQDFYCGYYQTVRLRDCDWVVHVFPYAN